MGKRIDLSKAEAIKALQIDSRTFRSLLKEFGEQLGDDAATLGSETLSKLKEILRWRSEGMKAVEISARLAGQEVAPTASGGVVLERLEVITSELEKSEKHRLEDRDRLLTAMMRTQQELTHLRYEMSSFASRKDRRRSLWARVLGR